MHLVRAGDEVVLVGVGEHGVTPIRTYGEDEARALGLIADDADDGPPADDRPAARGSRRRASRPVRGFIAARRLRSMTVIK